MIGRSGDVMHDSHCTCGGDKKRGFSDLSSKPVGTVCQWFGLKTNAMVSWFGPQNQCRRFGLGLKSHDSFFVWASKPSARRFACLCLETNEQMKTV
jgi:hypothetical protein